MYLNFTDINSKKKSFKYFFPFYKKNTLCARKPVTHVLNWTKLVSFVSSRLQLSVGLEEKSKETN